MKNAFLLSYGDYPLRRVLSIDRIVAADHILGPVVDLPHDHGSAVELVYCISGEIAVLRGEEVAHLTDRDVILIPPGTTHEVRSDKPDNELFVVSFNCTSEYLGILQNSRFTADRLQEERFQGIIKELRGAFRLNGGALRLFTFRPSSRSPLGAEQMICSYLEQIMIAFLRESASGSAGPAEDAAFSTAAVQSTTRQINDYIMDHLTEGITVSGIAAAFHYSRSRMSTLYKQATGLGIHEFITKELFSKAKELLSRGDLTITEVSEQLGFSSPEYFSRRFSQCVGMTPSRFVAASREHRQRVGHAPAFSALPMN